MKKKFMFTKDSSFTHVKDEMRHSLTEHIIQDDQTKKLYFHVVSHGSWIKFSYESIFMSHLLKAIGVTGVGVTYGAEDCKIDLPWYPYRMPFKAVVDLPEDIKLEDIHFGFFEEEVGDEYKQTFIGKKYKQTFKFGGESEIKGKDLLRDLFSCSVIHFAKTTTKDGVYPLGFVMYGVGLETKKDMIKKLSSTDISAHPEVSAVLHKFSELDIEKAIKTFEEELGADLSELGKDLVKRQKIAKFYMLEQAIKQEVKDFEM